MTKSPPSLIAVVRRLPASEPDAFSDSANAMSFSPFAIDGRYFYFLLFGGVEHDRERPEGVDRVCHADAATGAGELLDDEAEVEDTGALAAVLLRDPDPGELVLLERLEDVPTVLAGAVELGRAGADEFLRNLAGAVHVIKILFAEQLAHVSSDSKLRRILHRQTVLSM